MTRKTVVCKLPCWPNWRPIPAHLFVPVLFTVLAHQAAGKSDHSTATPHTSDAAPGGRESTLGGMCIRSTMSDQDTLRTLRRQSVKFNQKKSMYRDGDIIGVYTLDRPGHGSLAGCADACLLNWRLTDDETQALDTDCSAIGNGHCPMTSGVLVADRKCEAFMFNRLTGVCTLLSGERSMRLVRSRNFWSGKLICDDMSSVDDWAEGVVSRRSPPPPPPPSPPPPSPLLTTSGTLDGDATYIDANTVQLTRNVMLVQGLVYWEGVLGYSWEASFEFKANGEADALWFFAYRETNNLHNEGDAKTGYNFVADEYQNEYQLFAEGLSTVVSPLTGTDLGDDTWRAMEIIFSSDGTTDTIDMTVDGDRVITQSHAANPSLKYLEPTYYGFGGRTGWGASSHQIRDFQIVRT